MNIRFDSSRGPRFVFSPLDRVTIKSEILQWEARSGDGHLFLCADGSGHARYYTDEELSRLHSNDDVKRERNFYGIDEVKKNVELRAL